MYRKTKQNLKNMKKGLKNTQDTQEERLIKGSILIMDINALPASFDLNTHEWSKLVREQGILFYDSSKGDTPTFEPEDTTIKMYDVADEKMMKELDSILNKDEDTMKADIDPNLLSRLVITNLDSVTTITTSDTDTISRENYEYVTNSLTDNEVVQLEVQDPREQTHTPLIDGVDDSLTEEETSWIDEQMNNR